MSCQVCASGQACVDGQCRTLVGGGGDGGSGADAGCGPSSCAGCCQNGECKAGNLSSACGKNGSACATCWRTPPGIRNVRAGPITACSACRARRDVLEQHVRRVFGRGGQLPERRQPECVRQERERLPVVLHRAELRRWRVHRRPVRPADVPRRVLRGQHVHQAGDQGSVRSERLELCELPGPGGVRQRRLLLRRRHGERRRVPVPRRRVHELPARLLRRASLHSPCRSGPDIPLRYRRPSVRQLHQPRKAQLQQWRMPMIARLGQ